METTLAESKAGHDKSRIYVIVDTEGDYVFLADGKARTLQNPKKKKEKHIQPIKKLPTEVKMYAQSISEYDDSNIRKIIKLYNNRKTAAKES